MSGYNLQVRARMGIRDIADDSDTASSIRPRRPLDYQIRRAREALVHFILFTCAFISIFTTLAIVFVLFEESIRFFADVSIIDFLQASALRDPAPDGGYAAGRSGGGPDRDPGGAGQRYLPQRVRPRARALTAEAGPGGPGRYPHRRLRLLRPDVHHEGSDPPAIPWIRYIQRRQRLDRHGDNDHPSGLLAE